MTGAPTAACIVIGDEILTGKIQDRNSHVLAQVLFERGVRLIRVETIPDTLDVIAETTRRWSATVDFVFTSGGIGPTHDDRTYEGIARAFDVPLAYHDETLAKFEAHHQEQGRGPLNEARKRMALLPAGCQVWSTTDLWVPLVVLQNVHVLPGIPELFERMLRAHADRFQGAPLHRAEVYTDLWEGDIAEVLTSLQLAYPEVAIGSYPRIGLEAGYRVKITLDGLPRETVERVAEQLTRDVQGRRSL